MHITSIILVVYATNDKRNKSSSIDQVFKRVNCQLCLSLYSIKLYGLWVALFKFVLRVRFRLLFVHHTRVLLSLSYQIFSLLN